MKRRRRNPENPKKFLKICSKCVNLYLRKIIFEEFWNEKTGMEKELEYKTKEVESLTTKLIENQKKAEKQQNRQTNLRLNSAFHDELNHSIKTTENRIKVCEQKKSKLLEEQKAITNEIYQLDLVANKRKKLFKKKIGEKSYKKTQENKKISEIVQIKLTLKCFIEKIMEKNHIDRRELLKISIKKGDLDEGRMEMKNSGRFPSQEMYGMHSNLSLTRSEMSNFDRKKKNFNKKKKQKNAKLDVEETCGSSCKNACIIF